MSLRQLKRARFWRDGCGVIHETGANDLYFMCGMGVITLPSPVHSDAMATCVWCVAGKLVYPLDVRPT